jgi:hypothetical protein
MQANIEDKIYINTDSSENIFHLLKKPDCLFDQNKAFAGDKL